MGNPIKYLKKYLPGEFRLEKYGFYTLCLTLFLMPFPRSWSLWSLGIFLFWGLIVWINDFNKVKNLFLENWIILLPPVVYFLLYFLYFLTGHSPWDLVEDKLMFILVPLVGFSIFISDSFRTNLRYLLISFIAGIFVISLYEVFRAFVESTSFFQGSVKFIPVVSPGVSRFNWEQLSTFEHPTYFSIKILWGISLLMFANEKLVFRPGIRAVLILFFTAMLLLLSVKAAILILVILGILVVLSHFRKSVSWKIIIAAFPVLIIVLFAYGRLNIRTMQKIDELKTRIFIEKAEWKNIDPRMTSWYTSLLLIKENPVFGVGPGARDVLTIRYKELGYNTEAGLRLNSHNQYLETQLSLGIAGTIVLFWMLISLSIHRRKTWNVHLVTPFLIIVMVSMLFESILVRQWGIMFFILFYSMLLLPDKNSTAQNNHNLYDKNL
jgi:O-antigen ligase